MIAMLHKLVVLFISFCSNLHGFFALSLLKIVASRFHRYPATIFAYAPQEVVIRLLNEQYPAASDVSN